MKAKKYYSAPALSVISFEASPIMEGTVGMGKYEGPDTGATDALSNQRRGWAKDAPWSDDGIWTDD